MRKGIKLNVQYYACCQEVVALQFRFRRVGKCINMGAFRWSGHALGDTQSLRFVMTLCIAQSLISLKFTSWISASVYISVSVLARAVFRRILLLHNNTQGSIKLYIFCCVFLWNTWNSVLPRHWFAICLAHC